MERIKLAIIAGVFFGVAMSVVFSFIFQDILVGFIVGLSTGLLFGAFIYVFVVIMERRSASNPPPLEVGEELIFSGGASYLSDDETLGGYLYLTTERILFIPHALNINYEEFSLQLSEVGQAFPTKPLGISTGLLITDVFGEEHSFYVFKQKEWVEKINAVC